MPHTLPPHVHTWLTAHGWHPARDIGRAATDAIADRKRQLEGQVYPFTYEPPATIEPFLRSYGLLELPHPGAPEVLFCLDPRIAYPHDGEEIGELAENLGVAVFPVGYITEEGSVLVMDALGRVFELHHTGAYFRGADVAEAFASLCGSEVPADAEEYYRVGRRPTWTRRKAPTPPAPTPSAPVKPRPSGTRTSPAPPAAGGP
ncbi:SUKH-3 domain-containing protein [Streptomyces caatingaensis]|uniref:SUKH-3 domain containing protein n=1 Tax=Streptomyces caatingaensis TaxID=1678637 RepID=A0A0K9XCV0_9ACTN|nr:SUKH-3 domain-containing protein [Streptomyces caatingaensis]KNB51209.1 hypothetical protein AC230_19035 [Streptomyces caatingaensis]